MTAHYEVQLEGSIQFCATDSLGASTGPLVEYGEQVSSLVIGWNRATVERKPSFANATSVKRAGALSEQVSAKYIGDDTDATGFWALIYTAITTPPCEVYFEATMKVGAVSATNPKYKGFICIADLDGGGTPGETKDQSKTWGARDITRVTV
jgi:hypothetical protein